MELRLLSVISETLELVLSNEIFFPPGPSPSLPSSSLDDSELEGSFLLCLDLDFLFEPPKFGALMPSA